MPFEDTATPEGMLTDEQAAAIRAARGVAAAPPEFKDFYTAHLSQYDAFRQSFPRAVDLQESARKERVLEDLTLDFDKVTAGQDLMSLRMAPDEPTRAAAKDSLVVESYIRAKTGQAYRGATREKMRDAVATSMFGEGKGLGSDSNFITEARKYQTKGKDTRIQAESFATAGAMAALKLNPGDRMKELSALDEKAGKVDGMTPEDQKRFKDSYLSARDAVENAVGPYRQDARIIAGMLGVSAGAGSEEMKQKAIDRLAEFRPEEREHIVRLIASEKGADFSDSDEKQVRSAARGLASQMRGFASTEQRRGLLDLQKRLKNGSFKMFGDETPEKAYQRVLAGSLAPFMQAEEGMPYVRKATDEEAGELKQMAEAALTRNAVAGQVATLIDESIDPIKSRNYWEKIVLNTASSIGMMAPIMVPYAGVLVAQGGYADQEYQRQLSMGTDPETAHAMAETTGAIQAGVERVGFLFSFAPSSLAGKLSGKLAFNSERVAAMGNMTQFATRFLERGAVIQGAEYTEEIVQDATPSLTALLAEGAGWTLPEKAKFEEESKNWRLLNAETFLTVAALSMFGAGMQGVSQTRQAQERLTNTLGNPLAATGLGIPKTEAERIAALPEEERLAAFREQWKNRDPDTTEAQAARDGIARIDSDNRERGQRQVQELGEAGISITRTEDGFRVTDTADGTSVLHDTADEAMASAQKVMLHRGLVKEDTFLDALGEFANNMREGRTLEVSGKTETMLSALEEAAAEGKAQTVADIWTRAQQYRESRGEAVLTEDMQNQDSRDALAGLRVLGRSVTDAQNNAARSVSKIMNGGGTLDLVEEQAESDLKEAIFYNPAVEKQLEQAIARVEETTGDKFNFRGNIIEAWSQMVRLFATGTRNGNKVTAGARTETAADIRAIRRRLREVKAEGKEPELMAKLQEYYDQTKATMAMVARLMKAKAAGKLDDVEEMIREAVGLKPQDTHDAGVVDEAGRIYGGGGTSFSVSQNQSNAASEGISGLAWKLRPAYDRLVSRKGTDSVFISDLVNESGLPLAQVREWLRDYGINQGQATLDTGDWSHATEEQRAANVELRGNYRLYVRLHDGVGTGPAPAIQQQRQAPRGATLKANNPTLWNAGATWLTQANYTGDIDQGVDALLGPNREAWLKQNTKPSTKPVTQTKRLLEWSDKARAWESGQASFSIAPSERLENLAFTLYHMARDPDVRNRMFEDAYERLAGMARAVAHNDSVSDAISASQDTEMQARQKAALESTNARHEAETTEMEVRQETESDALAQEHEDALFQLNAEHDLAAGAAREEGWTADQRDALRVRQGRERDNMQHRQRAAVTELETKQQKEREKLQTRQRKESKDLKASQSDEASRRGAVTGDAAKRRDMLRFMQALDAVLAPFPAEVRGKVGGFTKLASLTTNEAMEKYIRKRIGKLNEVFERFLQKEYTDQMDALEERAKLQRSGPGERPAGRLGADTQRLMDAVAAARRMSEADLIKAMAGLDAAIASGQLAPEEQALSERERELVNLTGNWKARDASGMAAALKAVKETFEGGYLAWQAKKIAERERRAASRLALQTDAGKTGAAPERDARTEQDLGWNGRNKDFFLGLSSFEEVNRYLFGEDSAESRRIVDGERTAAYQYQDATDAMAQEVEDLFTAMGKDSRLEGERIRHRLATERIKVGQRSITELQGLQAALMWAQEDGKRHMIGPLDENGQPAGPWNYDQAWMDQLMSKLSPEALRVLAFIENKYVGEWAGLNPLYRERHGVDLPRHKNYAPITVAPQQARAGQMVDPVSGQAVSGSILTPGSLRSRSRSAIAEPDFKDALQVLLGHHKQMEHWKAYYDFAVDMQAVLGNREVGNSMEAAGGTEAKSAMRKWLDYFAQGGTRDAAAGLAITQTLGRMTGRAAAMALVGKPGVLFIQSTQLGAAIAEMPTGAYIMRLGKLLSGQLDWGASFRSEFIQRRIRQLPPIVRQALEGLRSAKPNAIKHQIARLGTLIGGADALFTAGTYSILHDYHMELGRKTGLAGAALESYATAEAVRKTERVAQPTRAGTRSLFENTATNPLLKLSWAFASEARQKVAMAAWAARNVKKDPAHAARVAFVVWGIGGALATIIRAAWKDAKDDDDKWSMWGPLGFLDETNWSLPRLVSGTLAGPLNGLPGIGDALDDFASRALGVRTPEGNLFSAIPKAVPAAKDLLTLGFADEPEPWEEALKDAESVMMAAGLFNDTLAAVATTGHAGREFFQAADNWIDTKAEDAAHSKKEDSKAIKEAGDLKAKEKEAKLDAVEEKQPGTKERLEKRKDLQHARKAEKARRYLEAKKNGAPPPPEDLDSDSEE